MQRWRFACHPGELSQPCQVCRRFSHPLRFAPSWRLLCMILPLQPSLPRPLRFARRTSQVQRVGRHPVAPDRAGWASSAAAGADSPCRSRGSSSATPHTFAAAALAGTTSMDRPSGVSQREDSVRTSGDKLSKASSAHPLQDHSILDVVTDWTLSPTGRRHRCCCIRWRGSVLTSRPGSILASVEAAAIFVCWDAPADESILVFLAVLIMAGLSSMALVIAPDQV